MSSTVVIAGAGHAAGQVVATLCQKKYAGNIVLVGEEPWLPYQRPPLSKKFLAGEMPAERLYVKPPAFYESAGVTVRLDTRVAKIDRRRKCVVDSGGHETGYDKLILALGARVRRLDLPGVELDGVHYLRNVQDVRNIHARMGAGRRICIVGAGYIGLEVAAVASQLGMDVTVVELLDRVMKRVVSPELSAFYEREHRSHGVKILLDTGIEAFVGDGQVRGLLLADGTEIPADVVVIGIGIVPNTEVAAEAGLPVNDGIVVDEYCRTADPDVYAVGDCTFHPNPVIGRSIRLESVQNALEQARTAAAAITGEQAPYAQVPWFWSDQYDLKLQIAGLSQGYDETVLRGSPDSRSFSCVYLRDGRVIALDAVNNPKDFLQAKKVIADGGAVDRVRLADAATELKDTV
ncbi:MAG TPA: FAD-dependent oxidoreductase [Woeseiaceae bacterium]|nr:FAD-dependent oxidoreductase [Woeseiaceae bacterium]